MNTTATPPTMTGATVTYASFGARFVALIIDSLVVGCLNFIVVAPLMTFLGLGVASQIQDGGAVSEEQAIGMVAGFIAAIFSAMIAVWVISLLYFSLMESSKTQGSLGKMAMGIKVTDLEGQRISFGKAFLRSIGKVISQMIMYIGYIMAAFTEKKQALHDIIASTLVVKK
jgi:uncharacterized RDD family membrane protein YckC